MRPPMVPQAIFPASTFHRWLRAQRAIGSVAVASGRIAGALREPEVAEVYFEASGQLVLFAGLRWRSELHVYAEVSRHLVRRRAIALAASRWAARDLGIAPPRMRFFVPIELAAACAATRLAFVFGSAVDGLAYPSAREIWIDARLPRREMVDVVAHEVKHIAQGDDEESASPSPATREAEARRYGRRVGRGPVARRARVAPAQRPAPHMSRRGPRIQRG